MNQKERQMLESFTLNFSRLVKELDHYSDYLKMNDDIKELKNAAMEILDKKAKKMEKTLKSDEIDKLKKIIRVNKLIEKGDGKNKGVPRFRQKI